MYSIVTTALEIIGTIAFAISGSLVAIERRLDLFGVLFLGCITATGGGMIRDVFIGHIPPTVFSNSVVIILAALTSIGVFVVSYINRRQFANFSHRIEAINNIFDALGLSVFSVLGVETVCASGLDDKKLFCILMGMITGVGGGIFRDILADKTPYVLKKHVYAMASLCGSALYYFLRIYTTNTIVGATVAMAVVFVIRILATKYLWQLPRIELDEDK